MTSNLKKFVIPKRRRVDPQSDEEAHQSAHEKVTAQLRSPTSNEEEIISDNFIHSLSDRRLRKYFKIENISMVENPSLLEKFQAFKKSLRAIRQSETFGYLLVDSDEELTRIINSGLSVGSSVLSDLGRVKEGVTVHRYADQVTPAPFFKHVKLRILCFKTLRGKIREVELHSSTVSASAEFNSHLVRPIYDRQLTPLEKFKSYSVFHYECGSNGIPVKTPSGLFPYAVYDIVSTYKEKQLTCIAPSRLKLSIHLINSEPVCLSQGLFAGSLSSFSTLSVHEREPTIRNLSSLHLQEKYYKWNMLLKLPIFVALLQHNNWGRLMTECEVEIKVAGNTEFYASYWTFWNDSAVFPKVISGLLSNHLSLVGCCGDTTLFLFPNGQLSSLLGIPHNNGSRLHCLAVNCSRSTLGVAPETLVVHHYERSNSTLYRSDVSYFVSAPLFQRSRVNSIVNSSCDIEDVVWNHECSFLPRSPRELMSTLFTPNIQLPDGLFEELGYELRPGNHEGIYIPHNLYQEQHKSIRCGDDEKKIIVSQQCNSPNYIDVDTKSNVVPNVQLAGLNQVKTELVDLETSNPSENETFMDPCDKDYDVLLNSTLLSVPIETIDHNKSALITVKQEVHGEMENTEDFVRPNDKVYEVLFNSTSLADPIKAIGYNVGAEQSSARMSAEQDVHQEFEINAWNNTEYSSSTTAKIVWGQPVACSNENHVPIRTTEVPHLINQLPKRNEDSFSSKVTEGFKSPNLASVVNYLKVRPAPAPKIYNGCEKLGYTAQGGIRRPLLQETPNRKITQPNNCEKVPQALLPTGSSKPIVSLLTLDFGANQCSSSVPKVIVEDPDIPRPHVILMDSEIFYGRLRPSDFDRLSRRLAVDKMVNHMDHKILCHQFIEADFCRRILHNENSEDKSCWMLEYLRLLKEYDMKNIVVKMEHHHCDKLEEKCTMQDKTGCLRYNIASIRRWNPSANIVYLTDLNECTIQDSFKDPRIRFVDYTTWTKIFQ